MMTISPTFIQLGPLDIRWYAVLIVGGAFLAMYLSTKEANQKLLPDDFILDLFFIAFPVGLIGARIYYVVFEWANYQNDLWKIFAVWEGGLAIYGGLIAGLGVVYWYSKKNNVSYWLVLDIITPNVLLAQAIGRWGNFINQEAHGGETTRQFLESLHLPTFVIEQMHINGTYYHPTFLYESLASLIGFFVLITLRKQMKQVKMGDITLFYVMWYGVTRFFVEGMRTDSLWLGPLRVSQALSLVLVIVAMLLYVWRRKQSIDLYQHYFYKGQ